MTEQSITVTFPDVSPDTAGALADSLAADIKRALPDTEPKIERIDKTAQDFGTTLVLVLGAPAIVVLARAVRDWAKRTDQSDIILNGVRITNVNSRDVAEIVRAINVKSSTQ